eukprot:Rhum_TRINITY_DN17152_c0_g1::Rhum_TRINITY_DN17152_c0_g1_i1::g.165379::m.165379/K10427/DCTN5; dynactin 5
MSAAAAELEAGEDASPSEKQPPPAPTEVEEELDEHFEVFEDGVLPVPEAMKDGEWKVTSRGCKISVESVLIGLSRIIMKDLCVIKRQALIRADLNTVNIGSHVIITESAVIRPPWRRRRNQVTFLPMKIGSFVHIGKNSTVEAAFIGSHVIVGDGAVVGRRCTVRSGVVIRPGSVVQVDTTLPHFTVWGGNPAVCLGYLHEGALSDIRQYCMLQYDLLTAPA